MAALEELKERLQAESSALWEKIQESSLFIKGREVYENLTPSTQKLVLAGLGLFAFYIFFSIPMGHFTASSESVETFESKRQLIRDMMKVSREVQDAPNIPTPPNVNTLKSLIENQLQSARLLPEQIKGTDIVTEKVHLLPGNLVQGVVNVSLAQLNLRQIIDVGFQLQSINSSVKMTDLRMQASEKDPRYYDVTYKLAVLNVPDEPEPAAEEPPQPKKRRN